MAALYHLAPHGISSASFHRSARKELINKRTGCALLFRKTARPVVRRNWTSVNSAHSAAEGSLPSTVSFQNELECPPENNMLGTVVIAGGGPAGCLMAHYLLRRGFSVQLFEKREAAKLGESYEQIYSRDDVRSYPMSITTRAVKPLDGAAIQLPSTLALRTVGFTQHFGGGKKVGKTPSNQLQTAVVKVDSYLNRDFEAYTVSRNALVGYLQHSLKQRYGGRLSTHFGWELVRISYSDNIVTFKRVVNDKTSEESEQLEVHYDLLIGADGANSVVRKELLRIDQLYTNPGESAITEEIIENPNWYKSFHISPDTAGKSPLYEDFDRTQRWVRLNMLLVGMADGSFWGGSSFPKLVNESNPDVVMSILREEAPEVLELVLEEDPEWCEKFVAQPSINMGKAIILSRFHKGNVVVIGDAAHAMFPTYGTGCNVALEDCAVMDKILQNLLNTGAGKDVLNQLGAVFTKDRIRDAHTIVRLSVTGELFTATKLEFLQRSFFNTLHNWFPKMIPRPASQFLAGVRSFSSIKKQKQVENIIFYSLLTIVALAFFLTSYKIARSLSPSLMRRFVK